MHKTLVALLTVLATSVCTATLDINQASEAELDSIKGIGPATSGKILEERQKGRFKDWNDLINRVKGIGNIKATLFSAEGVTVNGLTYQPSQAASKPQ